MRKVSVVSALFLVLALVMGVQSWGEDQEGSDWVIPGQYIVVLKDGVAEPGAVAQELAARHGLLLGPVYSVALKGFSAHIPLQKLEAITADPRVNFIEPDLVVQAIEGKGTPFTKGRGARVTDPQPPQVIPTGIDRIDAELSATAKINGVDERVNVDIAIIDTGVSKGHPDLNFYAGITCAGAGKPGGVDDNGHGSHVAGIAAAKDNSTGVVGVAPGARLWSVKVLDKYGYGFLSCVIAGVNWVTARASQIEVANMSLGTTGKSDAFRTALKNSVAAGILYVVAAGNSGKDVYGDDGIFGTNDDFIPAAYPEVATVSAIADSDGEPGGVGGSTSWGADDTFATFSNYSRSVVAGNPVTSPGAAVDLAAPGVNILSTWKGTSYNTISGTSMASPHVAGAAALYIAVYGKPVNAAGVAAVRQALIANGSSQSGPNGFTVDPDENQEPLVNAAFP